MPFLINETLLDEVKPDRKTYNKGEIIVNEGDHSQYFYFLYEGELSVFNFTEEGKEFLQHKVKPGNFFGEPAVLLGKPFPGNVEVASDKAVIIKFRRDNFVDYMMKYPEQMFEFTKSVAEKSIRKSLSLKNIVFLNPEDRVIHQLRDYKREHGKDSEKVVINLTRKELSNMTGLRIETIIRTVKKMEKEGKLEIINGKIHI